MVTIGDVFGIVATLFGIGISSWAILVACSLLFSSKTAGAQQTVEQSPWKCLFLGAVLTLVFGFLGIVMLGAGLPIGKLVGWLMLLAVMSLGAVGATGISQIITNRLFEIAPNLNGFQAMSRGAMILVVACIMPALGWFLIAPLALFAGVGAGAQVILSRRTSIVAAQQGA